MGVCGLLTPSCSSFSLCQSSNDACTQSDHVCVRHPRCNSQPLCYPLSLIDENTCPTGFGKIKVKYLKDE